MTLKYIIMLCFAVLCYVAYIINNNDGGKI